MREITSHVAGPEDVLNACLKIKVLDEPNSNGVSHLYRITGFDPSTNPSNIDPTCSGNTTVLLAQGSPSGVINGLTVQSLLAIVIDRLEEIERGEHKRRGTFLALDHCRKAMKCLHFLKIKRIEWEKDKSELDRIWELEDIDAPARNEAAH